MPSVSHLRARSYAVYAVFAVQILSWTYIIQSPTPRLQRKAWLDMVLYGCYVSQPLAAPLLYRKKAQPDCALSAHARHRRWTWSD